MYLLLKARIQQSLDFKERLLGVHVSVDVRVKASETHQKTANSPFPVEIHLLPFIPWRLLILYLFSNISAGRALEPGTFTIL